MRRPSRYNPLADIPVGDVDAVRSILASFFYDRDVQRDELRFSIL